MGIVEQPVAKLYRLGVAFLDCPNLISHGRRGQSAAQYLLLQQNLQQQIFDFSVVDLNVLIRRIVESPESYETIYERGLRDNVIQKRKEDDLRKRMRPESCADFMTRATNAIDSYKAVVRQDFASDDIDTALPDKWLVFTEIPFSGYIIGDYSDDVCVVSLAYWNKSMAPPTVVEFMINQSQSACVKLFLDVPEHYGSGGCLLDFNEYIDDFKFSVLGGVCTRCRRRITETHGQEIADALRVLTDKKWLGAMDEPRSAAAIARKAFGYDIQLTKGLAPSRWQVLWDRITATGTDEIIKLGFALALAYLLITLGLRAAQH